LKADPTPPRKRFLIIHNPIAGMRRRWMLHEVCRKLTSRGAELQIVLADSLDHGQRLARQAASESRFDAVLAAGGDSTARGVAAGLRGTDMPMGIIPVGTGNVLAHEIGLRRGPDQLSAYLMQGPIIPVCPGLANGEPFILMASAGFDARVLGRLNTSWKRRLGKLAYVWPVIAEVAARHPGFEVTVDGERRECNWLVVTKVKHYGGPFRIAPDQHIQSEGFHAVLIHARPGLELTKAMTAIAMGRSESHSGVEIRPCRHVSVAAKEPVATQLDGEAFAFAPLEIEMGTEPVNLIVSPAFKARPATRHGQDDRARTRAEAVHAEIAGL